LNLPFVPVKLIAPVQISYWLNFYHKKFEKIKNLYELVSNVSLLYNFDDGVRGQSDNVNNIEMEDNNILIRKVNEELFRLLSLKSIETAPVHHCPHAFGVALVHESGWKLSYSGDTMPCDSFISLGQDSDICIHEATMEDELVHEARLKMHSTTSEAIEIGNKMNAKFTMLTHFSQRYAKVPKIDSGLAPNVGIAFDNMIVSILCIFLFIVIIIFKI